MADFESGWDTEGGDYDTGSDYQTVGAPAMQAPRFNAPRAAAPGRSIQMIPQRAPQRPAPAPYRPQPAASSGPSVEQVRSLVQSEIDAALRRRVPFADIPPRPNPDEAMFPMGLGSITLTSVLPSASLIARPQRAFRGERLVLAVQRSVGAAGVTALLTEFLIGDYKQLVGGGSLPADVFASDAFGVRLMLDGSTPGVLYQIDFSAAVPPGETITIAGAVIGRAGQASER